MCQCGHHEGYHNDAGECLHAQTCKCTGLDAGDDCQCEGVQPLDEPLEHQS